jgi:flagellar hook-length control protein FliK
VRASATSRISSAHLPAAQNKTDANKADAASPFALLVQDAAPKDAAKTAHKEAHDDKKDADKPSAKTDNKADASTQAQAKPVQTAKIDKSDKTDEKAGDKTAKPNDAGQEIDAAATQDQAAAPQPVNPQIQQAAQPGAATAAANDDGADADEIAAAGKAQDTKAPAPAAQNNAPVAPAANEDQTQDAQAAAINTPAAKSAGKPAKADSAKTDTKPGDIKAAKAGDAADSSSAANAADTKTDDANAALNAKAAATHDAARPADTNHQAVNSLTAPQGQQPAQSAAPTLTQHVQVSAQPTPNVPALAVEIAAKSQSGAKQFDIRLDPPELGRVEVRLSIDATGKASAHLSADTPQTLDLLQKDAPALTRALREAGLDVSQDGLNFSLRHQGSQDSNANNSGSRGNGRGFALTATNSIDATATSAAYRSVADGRLDIKV